MPGDHRGFDAEIFVPEGGLARLARGIPPGGTGFVGWAERVPPPQTGLWAFPPAKSSKTFLAPFLTSFLVLSSPLSLSFSHPFPHPVSMQTTKFWRIPGEVAELWLHTCCFSPACPCPSCHSRAGAVTGGHWDSEGFTPGMGGRDFSSR